jgi:membrane-bound lytic murein transglycosylase D
MRHLMWPQYERAGCRGVAVRIMAKESNGKVHATSRAGAAGRCSSCMQPDSASASGTTARASTRDTTRRWPRGERPYLNERMGAQRSIELALAAYNGGEGRAQRVYQAVADAASGSGDLQPVPAGNAGLRADGDRRGVAVPASARVRPRCSPRGRAVARRALAHDGAASIYQVDHLPGQRVGEPRWLTCGRLRYLNPRLRGRDSWGCQPDGDVNAIAKIVGLQRLTCIQGKRGRYWHGRW